MEYVLEITGMHCDGCARSLEQFLGAEPGVVRATVDYESQRGTVTTDGEMDLAPLLEAIRQMGYEAELVDEA